MDTWPDPPLRYAAATLVVIGKSDLLPVDTRGCTVERIGERVRARNPHAQVVVAEAGRIDPALVFDTASQTEPEDELPIAALMRADTDSHEAHVHAHAVAVPLTGPVTPGVLINLLEEPPEGAYRVKGRIRVRGPKADRGYGVNVVGRMIHITPLATPPLVGELVAIGPHLNPETAQHASAAVAAAPADRPDIAGLRRLHRYRRLSD